MEYKKIEVEVIDGYTITSRTLALSEEEEQKKFSEIKALLQRLSTKHQNKNNA